MSRSSEIVKKWRRNTKRRLIEGFGGKCCCCGYNRCMGSLDFHHLDGDEKESLISTLITKHISAWEKIVKEVVKCVLVCKNCHGEINAGLRKIPKKARRFKSNYSPPKRKPTGQCAVCEKDVYYGAICCGKKCAAKRGRDGATKHIKDSDLKKHIQQGDSYLKISIKYGVSDAAIRKRCKKIGIKSKFALL